MLPVRSKSLKMLWAVPTAMFKRFAISLYLSPIPILCQTTLHLRSSEYGAFLLGSADILSRVCVFAHALIICAHCSKEAEIRNTSTGVENRVRLILMRMRVRYGTELGSNRRENCSTAHCVPLTVHRGSEVDSTYYPAPLLSGARNAVGDTRYAVGGTRYAVGGTLPFSATGDFRFALWVWLNLRRSVRMSMCTFALRIVKDWDLSFHPRISVMWFAMKFQR